MTYNIDSEIYDVDISFHKRQSEIATSLKPYIKSDEYRSSIFTDKSSGTCSLFVKGLIPVGTYVYGIMPTSTTSMTITYGEVRWYELLPINEVGYEGVLMVFHGLRRASVLGKNGYRDDSFKIVTDNFDDFMKDFNMLYDVGHEPFIDLDAVFPEVTNEKLKAMKLKKKAMN